MFNASKKKANIIYLTKTTNSGCREIRQKSSLSNVIIVLFGVYTLFCFCTFEFDMLSRFLFSNIVVIGVV